MGRGVDADGGSDVRRRVGVASVAFERGEPWGAGCQQGEMGARGVALDGDPFGVDHQVGGGGTHPPDGCLDVMDLGRPRRLGEEPVLARHADIARPAQEDPVPAELRPVTVPPAAAVHEEDGRGGFGEARRGEDVAAQVAATAGPEDDALPDRDTAFHGRRRY